MQMYYEFYEEKSLNMHHLNGWYSNWNHNHHEAMGWLLEEIPFPFEYEGVNREKAAAIEDFAEITDTSVFLQIYEQILNCAFRVHVNNSNLNVETYVYHCYCQFLFKSLLAFSEIMGRTVSTIYFDHFNGKKYLIESLADQLKAESSRISLEASLYLYIEITANQLTSVWNAAIFTAARELR